MYEQIADNKIKTTLLFVSFFAFVGGFAWLIGYLFDIRWLFPAALIISIIQAITSYYYGDVIALAVSQAKPIEKSQNAYIYRIVENLAITAGVPTPKIYIISDTAINAFATGRDPEHASVAVTTGAIERLQNEELEGVIAHELSHIGNYDIRIATIVVVLVGIVSIMSNIFLRSMYWGGGRRRDRSDEGGQLQAILMVVAIVLAILAPLAATLIQLAVSRKREYLADASGALLTRYPQGLANALEKIKQDAEPLEVANQATAHLYFANPLKGYAGRINNLFSTHPPIDDRIKRLRAMA